MTERAQSSERSDTQLITRFEGRLTLKYEHWLIYQALKLFLVSNNLNDPRKCCFSVFSVATDLKFVKVFFICRVLKVSDGR